jgi:hypothetical protein
MKYTEEEILFIKSYINTVSMRLQRRYNLSKPETDILITDSVFYKLIQEDPEYVVNHNVNYWVDDIYKGMTTAQRLKHHLDENGKEYYTNIIEETKRVLESKNKTK